MTELSEVGQVPPPKIECFPHASTLGCWLGFTVLGVQLREGYSRMGTDSAKDKTEGTLDKTIGHVREAAGSLTGNKALKAAGQVDQAKGTLKKKGAAKDLLS
jgi:uncharacterized protein YjbJ (UPF0337 family)